MSNRPKKLLSVGTNAKTSKSDKAGEYLTAILYLSPHKENSKRVNLCPNASQGCAKACLFTAGRGKFNNVKEARINKTEWFLEDRKSFVEQLEKEIVAFSRSTIRKGLKPAIRLNGTSDVLWERYIDMSKYPEVQFYDYTKFKSRMTSDKIASNYHLTYSRAEDTSDTDVSFCLENKMNVAVVFKELPKTYMGYPVHNGDSTDLRFLDPDKHIIGLIAKGEAKKDTSGFVVNLT